MPRKIYNCSSVKGVGWKISGAFKKMTGSSSSRSQGGSSSRHSPEPTPTPTMMDYEQDEQEEQFEEQATEPQAEEMEIDEESKLWSYQSSRSRPSRENRYGR